MKLKMVRGREASLIIEDVRESITQDGFLASSYEKALLALCNYMERTDPIRKSLSSKSSPSDRNGILYRSPQNIIAFSGKRGCGKSSSLLSFSSLLASKNQLGKFCSSPGLKGKYSILENRHFVVIDPIDPTTLEQNQSILSVILSRLLFAAERTWSRNASFYGGFQDKESQKTELLTLARRCLNGICAIKESEKFPQDLADLQKVGDSSILKKNLYDFVELFLQFCGADTGVPESGTMLVLQIDDTDCQISQGYEIMEDIRKYLTIPNVLILMATDTKLLRQVLTQHYVSDFRSNLDNDLIRAEEVWALGEKYLAKLMPPSYVVHLSNIDDIIRDRASLIHFYYYDYDAEDQLPPRNLLNPCGSPDYECYGFQSVILRYIYRKTHVVFKTHEAYANNIIPTTLRGLAYLLGQLSSMEDIPEIDLAHEPFDAKYLAHALSAQFDILEKNLNLVEEYFLHDWIPAKLPQELVNIMEKLAAQALDQRIPFIMRELAAYYGKKLPSEPFQYGVNDDYSPVTYADLDEQIRIIQGTHISHSNNQFRQKEDFYFIFAIRTLLTIKNNKELLRLKRRSISSFDLDGGDVLVFDYLNGRTSIPTGFYLEPVNLYGYQLSAEELGKHYDYIKEIHFRRESDRELFKNLYFNSDYHSGGVAHRFNFTGGVVKWLSPKKDDYNGMMCQREIFIAQEAAALMAANCDVQEAARKAVVLAADTGSYPKARSFSEAVEQGLGLIQDAIAHMNQGMLAVYGPAEEGTTAWKLSPKWKGNLNAFYRKTAEKARESEKNAKTGKTGNPPYPKFEIDPPMKYNEERNRDFFAEVHKYTDGLRHTLTLGNLRSADSIDSMLYELETFKFKHDQDNFITNYNDFELLLKSLYVKLDALFSSDLSAQI